VLLLVAGLARIAVVDKNNCELIVQRGGAAVGCWVG